MRVSSWGRIVSLVSGKRELSAVFDPVHIRFVTGITVSCVLHETTLFLSH